MKFCNLFILFMVILSGGCKERRITSRNATNHVLGINKIQQISDIQRLLASGMGTNQIIAELGVPSRIEKLDPNETIWSYQLSPFLADGKMRGTYVVGLVITLTNGNLAAWGCDYMEGVQD